jgi:hypothetical protein
MDLLETIDDILEQEKSILPKDKTKTKVNFEFDENMFDKMANFIINPDPDSLSDSQVESVINMIEELEVDVEELDELRKPKMAKKTVSTENQYSKRWYRKNRTNIKRRKAKFRRSSEGRKRLMKKKKLAKMGRTPTGRKKVRYHVRKKSDRRVDNEPTK